MPAPAGWMIEPLRGNHHRSDFACGNPSLDRYLKERAGQDLRRGCATPFVLVSDRGNAIIQGYYTLSSYGIDVGELPIAVAKKLPRYPSVPVARLGRLAVDQAHRGRHLGGTLLWDAVARAARQGLEAAAGAAAYTIG